MSPKKATAAAERSRFFIKFRNCLPISRKSELNVTKFIRNIDVQEKIIRVSKMNNIFASLVTWICDLVVGFEITNNHCREIF